MPEPEPRHLAFGVEPSDRRYRLRLARYERLARVLAGFVRTRDGVTDLLDVGVGRGRSLRWLEPTGLADRVRWTGIDLHPDTPLRIHRRERWRLVLGDVSRSLPFRDAAFDAVVCEQVLEHVDDPAAVLAEAARCLRPGGLLVVGVPTFPPGVAAIRRRLEPLLHGGERDAHGHVQSFSAPAFLRLVRRSGAFRVEDVRGFRSASGGVLAPLEDLRAWWRLNVALGRAFPWLCAEIQVVARRVAPPG